MQSPWPKSNLRAAIISIGVVACLCFSIGEGLRLTPFPVALLGEIEAFNHTDDSLQHYGPLNQPTRSQSRNKRPLAHFAFAPPAPLPEPPGWTGARPRAHLDSRSGYTGAPSIGRAPPAY